MKALFLCCCFLVTINLHASEDKILKMIVEDIQLSSQLYKDYSASYPCNYEELFKYVRLISIDTTTLYVDYKDSRSLCRLKNIYKKTYSQYKNTNYYMPEPPTSRLKFISYNLYSVKIAIDISWYANKRKGGSGKRYVDEQGECHYEKEYDTLNYFIISYYGTDYYKLFGFFVTDIHEIVSTEQFKGFVKALKEEQILSKKEAGFYLKSIMNEEPIIHWKVNRPCEYFRYQYLRQPKELQSSIILRRKLLRTPLVQSFIDRATLQITPCK